MKVDSKQQSTLSSVLYIGVISIRAWIIMWAPPENQLGICHLTSAEGRSFQQMLQPTSGLATLDCCSRLLYGIPDSHWIVLANQLYNDKKTEWGIMFNQNPKEITKPKPWDRFLPWWLLRRFWLNRLPNECGLYFMSWFLEFISSWGTIHAFIMPFT